MSFVKATLSINELVYKISNYLCIDDKFVFYLVLEIAPSFEDIQTMLQSKKDLNKKYMNLEYFYRILELEHLYMEKLYNELTEKYKLMEIKLDYMCDDDSNDSSNSVDNHFYH